MTTGIVIHMLNMFRRNRLSRDKKHTTLVFVSLDVWQWADNRSAADSYGDVNSPGGVVQNEGKITQMSQCCMALYAIWGTESGYDSPYQSRRNGGVRKFVRQVYACI